MKIFLALLFGLIMVYPANAGHLPVGHQVVYFYAADIPVASHYHELNRDFQLQGSAD